MKKFLQIYLIKIVKMLLYILMGIISITMGYIVGFTSGSSLAAGFTSGFVGLVLMCNIKLISMQRSRKNTLKK